MTVKKQRIVSCRCNNVLPTKDYGTNIRETLKTLRDREGISQRDLAAKLGYADNMISLWERGVHDASQFNLAVWAGYFNYELHIRPISQSP